MTDIILTSLAVAALDTLVSLPSTSAIGGITVDTTIEEIYEDALEVTEHPVQTGAPITDHSFKRPMELTLRCGWSDSSIRALVGSVQNALRPDLQGTESSFTGGYMKASDYVAGIYSQLLELQEARAAVSIVTGMRVYDAMLMTSVYVRRDQRTRFALFVEATLRQVIFVNTSAATLAPQDNQADPASTAESVNAGSQQLRATSPAPGGALPPVEWLKDPGVVASQFN